MMRFNCSANVGDCLMKFQVDAATGTDAGTIGRAYMLTQGARVYTWQGTQYVGPSPANVTRPGVVPIGKAVNCDLSNAELRTMAWLQEDGRTVRPPVKPVDANPAAFESGHGWINLYSRPDGTVHPGGVYATKEGAKQIADTNGNGYRSAQAKMTWDPKVFTTENIGKLYPDGNGGWVKEPPYETSRQETERTGLNFTERAELAFGKGGYYVTHRNGPKAVPSYWSSAPSHMREAARQYMLSYLGLNRIDYKVRASISEVECDRDRVIVSFTSKRWQEITAEFRSQLAKRGIERVDVSVGATLVALNDLRPWLGADWHL